MFNSEIAQKKWAPLLEHSDVAPIKDPYKKAVTAVLLENQERAMREAAVHASFTLTETAVPETTTTSGGGFGVKDSQIDPVLIAMVRRAMPNLIAYDVCGVQPMSGPTGLIFALKSLYASSTKVHNVVDGAEAFGPYGVDGNGDPNSSPGIQTGFAGLGESADGTGSAGDAYLTSEGEVLSDASEVAAEMGSMKFEIVKAAAVARTRALKAGYTMELAQDLKAVHGLDAEGELANILSAEILAEINREVITKMRSNAVSITDDAKLAGATYGTQSPGTFGAGLGDGAVDLAGHDGLGARWGQEKFQALAYIIEKQANKIALATRRGKGNFVIVSSNIGSALAASGSLHYSDGLTATGLNIDATGNTFAGTLNGNLKVYIDPYLTTETVLVGYRGPNPYDAGMFYCPYVPLTMVKAIGENDFQPKIAFKTRYALQDNPYHSVATGLAANNPYYRKFTVASL